MTTRIVALVFLPMFGPACFPGPLPIDDTLDTGALETSAGDTDVDEAIAADTDSGEATEAETVTSETDAALEEVDASDCDDTGDCVHLVAACKSVACVDRQCVVSNDDDAACSDDDLCTTGDHCSVGLCVSTPKSCPASTDPCRENQCDPLSGSCAAAPTNEGASCDDENPCTISDACASGACVGAERVCASTDSCLVNGVCEATGQTTWTCDFDERPDDSNCDDDDHCTVGELCSDAECGGGVLPTDEDWIYRVDPGLTYGRTTLTVDAFGTSWWLVSLTETVTSFAPGVTATLPDGATSGIARVELDPQGDPRYATVLVHSTGDVRLPFFTQRFASVVSKSGHANGPQSTFVFGTFNAPVGYVDAQGAAATATPKYARSYFLGVFDDSGYAERFFQIESGQFSEQDTSQGVFPSIGVGPTGAAVVVVPVRTERDAEIVGRATAPSGAATSDWVLYFSPTGVLSWQGELSSPPAPAQGAASTVYAALDVAGSVWLGGPQFGTVLWSRTDGVGLSGQLPAALGFQDAVITRLAANGDFLGAAQFTGGGILRTTGASVDELGERFATALYFQQDLFVVESAGSRLIYPDDPLASTQIGLVTLNAQMGIDDLVVSDGANLAWFEMRPDALVVALIGGSDLRRDAAPVFGSSLVPHGINIGGIPFDPSTDAWSFAALTTASSASNIGIADRQIALSGTYGVVIAGRVNTQQHEIASSGAILAVDEAFVLRMNSEDGQACRAQ